MSTSAIGGLHGFLHELVHTHAPHTPAEFYLLSLIGAVLFAGVGAAISLSRRRGRAENGSAHSGFTIANLSSGSSFVIYILMPLVPFDEDLLAPLAQSWFTVALAGIIGASITLQSLWRGPRPAQPPGMAEARDVAPPCGTANCGTSIGTAGGYSNGSARLCRTALSIPWRGAGHNRHRT